MTVNILNIGQKIIDNTASIDDITMFVSLLMPTAIEAVNAAFSPRQLCGITGWMGVV